MRVAAQMRDALSLEGIAHLRVHDAVRGCVALGGEHARGRVAQAQSQKGEQEDADEGFQQRVATLGAAGISAACRFRHSDCLLGAG